MKFRDFIYLFFALFILQSVVIAQGINEPLTKEHYEVGYSHYWYSGHFYWNPANPSTDETWSNGTIYIRAGLYDYITLSVEGMLWPVTSYSNYPGESFLNYTFGITLSSPTIDLIFFELFLNIHYLENMYLDQSDQKNDKRFRNLQIGIPARYQFLKSFAVWLAPVYVWNESEYFEAYTYTRSLNSAGISVGLDALFLKHVYLNIKMVYVENLQPNIVIGYRL